MSEKKPDPFNPNITWATISGPSSGAVIVGTVDPAFASNSQRLFGSETYTKSIEVMKHRRSHWVDHKAGIFNAPWEQMAYPLLWRTLLRREEREYGPFQTDDVIQLLEHCGYVKPQQAHRVPYLHCDRSLFGDNDARPHRAYALHVGNPAHGMWVLDNCPTDVQEQVVRMGRDNIIDFKPGDTMPFERQLESDKMLDRLRAAGYVRQVAPYAMMQLPLTWPHVGAINTTNIPVWRPLFARLKICRA